MRRFPYNSPKSVRFFLLFNRLTEKERSVIVLYYYEDMTLKEISMTLEVSESRDSQLHTKALNKMKKIMGDYMFPA